MIALLLYSVLATVHCGMAVYPENEPSSTGKILTFTNVEDSTCFFRITVCGDSASGFFVGSEPNSAGEKIYYAADCRELLYREKELSFVLTEYCYSRTPMTSVCDEGSGQKPSFGVPFLTLAGMYFDGAMVEGRLSLGRVSDFYDSRADVFTFAVSSEPCECSATPLRSNE